MKIYTINDMQVTAIDVAIEYCHTDAGQDFYGVAQCDKVMALVELYHPEVKLTKRMAEIAVSRYNRASERVAKMYQE